MMDFLRALRPLALSHTAKTRPLAPSHAVPVVRSRFEDSRPLAHVPAVHVETFSQRSIADQRDMAGPDRAISRLVESVRGADAEPTSRAVRHVVTTTDNRVALSEVSEQLPVRSTPQPLQVRAVPVTRETVERTEPGRALPRATESPALLRVTQPVSAPSQTAAVPVGLTMPEAARPPVRGPLSSAAVASRTESRLDTRPVIHVTIDRIDVRAPSVPERASSRPRSRSNASASLSDYLRSRQTPRSGGTS